MNVKLFRRPWTDLDDQSLQWFGEISKRFCNQVDGFQDINRNVSWKISNLRHHVVIIRLKVYIDMYGFRFVINVGIQWQTS